MHVRRASAFARFRANPRGAWELPLFKRDRLSDADQAAPTRAEDQRIDRARE